MPTLTGIPMRIPIQSPADLGVLIRALRKSASIRQDDLAAATQVSKQFATDVEHGKPTAQLGLVLRLLAELGARVEIDVHDSVKPFFDEVASRFAAQQGKHQKRSPRRQAGAATEEEVP